MIDKPSKQKRFDQLRPEGTITYRINKMYDIPEVEIDFNGSYKSTTHFWPKATRSRHNFFLLERTPSSSQSFYRPTVVQIQYFNIQNKKITFVKKMPTDTVVCNNQFLRNK